MSGWATSRTRRAVDIGVSVVVLVVCCAPMLLIALVVRCTSPGRALFCQRRVGQAGELFHLFKFRSMAEKQEGPGLSRVGDARITACGRLLRKFKLDELPQFWNVLKGDMSLVGPRPKLPQYAAIRNMPYRPGITGLASLAFRSEEQMLARVPPDRLEPFYNERIKPLKANLDVCYMCHATPASDLRILTATVVACVFPSALPAMLGSAAEPRRAPRVQPVASDTHSGD